jgi:hypothetical protein
MNVEPGSPTLCIQRVVSTLQNALGEIADEGAVSALQGHARLLGLGAPGGHNRP